MHKGNFPREANFSSLKYPRGGISDSRLFSQIDEKDSGVFFVTLHNSVNIHRSLAHLAHLLTGDLAE